MPGIWPLGLCSGSRHLGNNTKQKGDNGERKYMYQEILDCKLVRKQDCNPEMLPQKMIISSMIIITDFKT